METFLFWDLDVSFRFCLRVKIYVVTQSQICEDSVNSFIEYLDICLTVLIQTLMHHIVYKKHIFLGVGVFSYINKKKMKLSIRKERSLF